MVARPRITNGRSREKSHLAASRGPRQTNRNNDQSTHRRESASHRCRAPFFGCTARATHCEAFRKSVDRRTVVIGSAEIPSGLVPRQRQANLPHQCPVVSDPVVKAFPGNQLALADNQPRAALRAGERVASQNAAESSPMLYQCLQRRYPRRIA